MQLAARGLKPVAQLAEHHPHGVRLRYLGGCRCLKCRMANSNYETSRLKARASGDWNGIVDAAPARRHIKKLSIQGVGYKQVAAAASVSTNITFGIRSGRRKRARARTVRKICAVTVKCRGDGALIPGARAWQRIGKLLEEGYSKAEIARMLGYKTPKLQLRRDVITVKSDAAVAKLYRRLMT